MSKIHMGASGLIDGAEPLNPRHIPSKVPKYSANMLNNLEIENGWKSRAI